LPNTSVNEEALLFMVRSILQAWFGHFTYQELKKYTLLGVIFSCMIGIYWTLRPLKDALFMSMVGAKTYVPLAKITSLIMLLPLIIFYSKLVDRFARHRMIYVMVLIYSVVICVFGLLFLHPTLGLANKVVDPTRILGWAWYVFVESYGSLMIALFWAFATDITDQDGARRGFPFVIMIGQAGSIIGPLFLTPLAAPKWFGSSAYVVLLCAAILLFIIPLVALFMRVIPRSSMQGYKPAHEYDAHHKEAGFLEGLVLLLKQPYLLGIFGIVAIYEIIVTIIDFNFKTLVESTVADEWARTLYLGDYAIWVNIVAFGSLALGASNIQRRLGLKVTLIIMPFIIGAAVIAFYLNPSIQVLFWLMVGAKGFNYSLNNPAQKQLYVPTSHEVKYKSQAWIETFGSRSSKAAGSGFNMFQSRLIGWFGAEAGFSAYMLLSLSCSMGLLVAWFFIARFLGNTYQKAVDEKQVVC